MRKKLALWIIFGLLSTGANAQEMNYIDEVKALGSVAGQGLACGASRYDTYELLARAILISKASSDAEQARGMYAYNEAKANVYMSKQMDGMYDCREINARFNNQKIFDATLYADGTIKMPNGEVITPRQAYDASVIYKKDSNERSNAQKIYDKGASVKVGEVKLKDGDGNIQTIHVPEKIRNVSSSKSVQGAQPLVSRVQAVEKQSVSSSNIENTDSGIGHIKSKWQKN